jgi:hypothetical protein
MFLVPPALNRRLPRSFVCQSLCHGITLFVQVLSKRGKTNVKLIFKWLYVGGMMF